MNSLIKPASEPMSYGKNNETKAIGNFIHQTGNQVNECEPINFHFWYHLQSEMFAIMG